MDRLHDSSGSVDNSAVAALAKERAWPAMTDCSPRSNPIIQTRAKKEPLYEGSQEKHQNDDPYWKGNGARDDIGQTDVGRSI